MDHIPVIDLFAGPGGLSEGFSAFECDGVRPFRVALSVEKDGKAHQTLRLRSFFRQFASGKVPECYYDVLRGQLTLTELEALLQQQGGEVWDAWCTADSECLHTELGTEAYHSSETRQIINRALKHNNGMWVLIGGPPCQAYSIVGRSRNRGVVGYKPEADERNTLYREYLKILADQWPAIFVMENVKGLLSATLENRNVFQKIVEDLCNPSSALGEAGTEFARSHRYRLISVICERVADPEIASELRPSDFVIKAEQFGIPQVRHRVILVGLRDDLPITKSHQLTECEAPTVEGIIGRLPRLRSGISRFRDKGRYVKLEDSAAEWERLLVASIWREGTLESGGEEVVDRIRETIRKLSIPKRGRGAPFIRHKPDLKPDHPLHSWYIDTRIGGVCNHETRSHLNDDILRYLFAASYARVHGKSPTLRSFPEYLMPDHSNANTGKFNDRFRVQVASQPASTVTCHISRDGHYFIHYDPSQCRSLTVREAARLQTFPDNYFFCGPRTSQYVQVGNAVPPLLARQIAEVVYRYLDQMEKA